MKYNLRSASADQETNQLSPPLSNKKFSTKNHQMKYDSQPKNKKKIIKKNPKAQPKSSQTLTKRNSRTYETIQQGPLHDSILRFPLKYTKKTLRVYCYKESDLQIQKRFRKCYGQHEKDDDLESWESLIEEEVERCKKDLFESVRKYSEAQSQGKNEEKNELEVSTDDSNKPSCKIEVKKKGKKISKRQKNKKNQ